MHEHVCKAADFSQILPEDILILLLLSLFPGSLGQFGFGHLGLSSLLSGLQFIFGLIVVLGSYMGEKNYEQNIRKVSFYGTTGVPY